MLSYVNVRLTRVFSYLSVIAALLILSIGGAVLSLWFFSQPLYSRISPRGIVMTPFTAFCFIVISVCLLCLHKNSKISTYIFTAGTLFSAAAGALIFGGYLSGVSFDHLHASAFGRDIPFAGFLSMKMSVLSSMNFFLCGTGLLMLRSRGRLIKGIGEAMILANGIVALLVLVGYAFATPDLYTIVPHKSIAMYTALNFLLICPAALFAGGKSDLLAVLTSDTEGGFMARRMLFLCVFIPFVLGWMVILGQHKYLYDMSMGVSLLTILIIVIFTFLIWDNAMSLHVTDLKRMKVEDALRASEDKYRVIFETTGTAMAVFEENKMISLVNTGFEKLSGYPKAQIEGVKMWTEFVGSEEDSRRMREYHRVRRLDPFLAPGTYEFVFIDRWGVRKDVFITIAMIPGTARSIASMQDVTERKKIERMKSDFVSLVSHQLKTPVAQIKGYVYNMLSGLTGELSAKQREYLEEMRDISDKNYKMLSDLLNVSRIERGVIYMDLKPVALKDIVDSALGPYYARIKEKGLALDISGLEEDIVVMADREKLSEAVGNTVDNAIKFTPAGGISIRVFERGEDVFIEVADTGRGISPDRLAKMFSRDMALDGGPVSGGGAGLGLYIAKQFMIMQKGDVTLESEQGKGTVFSFRIPAA